MNVLVMGVVGTVFDPKKDSKSFTFTVGNGVSLTSFGSLKQQLMTRVGKGDFVVASGSTNVYKPDAKKEYHSVVLDGGVSIVSPEDVEDLDTVVAFSGIGVIEDIDIRQGKSGEYALIKFTEEVISFRGSEQETYQLGCFNPEVVKVAVRAEEGKTYKIKGRITRNKRGDNYYTNYELSGLTELDIASYQMPVPEEEDPYGDRPIEVDSQEDSDKKSWEDDIPF